MEIVVVTNLKGGTSKTTSAAFLAHAFHEKGRRVLLVDADPQGSAMRWQEDAEWPIAVIRMDSRKLHQKLSGVVGDNYDVIVIDTPPSDLGIVASAMRIATHIVVPMAPTPAEYDRLGDVRALVEETSALRADGVPDPVVAVLLTRTVPGAASTGVYRDLVREDGLTVLRPEVRRLERYSQALGMPVMRAAQSAYGDAVTELETMAGTVAR
jgi:chromosome partitioning protein